MLRPKFESLRASFLSMALALSAAACGNSPEDDESSISTTVDLDEILRQGDISPDQLDLLEDGTVTTVEYQLAFERFRECANARGDEIVFEDERSPVSGAIAYGVRGDLDPPGSGGSGRDTLNTCYQRFFSFVELAWQLTDPVFLSEARQDEIDHFNELFRPCLEATGISVPVDIEPGTAQYGRLSQQAVDLINANRCGG